MKFFLVTLVLMIFVLSGLSQTADFEVTKVIHVDSNSTDKFGGAMKWSPDGTKLLFFKGGGELWYSDTLGNATYVDKLQFRPKRFEWISDTVLSFQYERRLGHGSSEYKLVIYDLDTHDETLIGEYIYDQGFRSVPGNTSYRGPFLTLEGNAYYEIHTFSGDKSQSPDIQRSYFDPNKNLNDNVILWHDDGLYLKKLEGHDSTLLRNGFGTQDLFVKVSRDAKFINISYNIINLINSSSVVILDYLGKLPENTFYCDLMHRSFNPNVTELLFELICEGEDPYMVEQVGLFDYNINNLIILDTLINLNNCTMPTWHPDGNKISLLSGGKIYIIYAGRLRDGTKD